MLSNMRYEEEHKELILVKAELNRLKQGNNLNIANYLNWSGDDIVSWLVTLDNGEYKQYESVLRAAFDEENVNGKGIVHIDKPQLKEWGIRDFMHKNNIYAHFQSLLKQNVNDDNDYNEEEGKDGTPYIG